jgi:hypothetical protein
MIERLADKPSGTAVYEWLKEIKQQISIPR